MGRTKVYEIAQKLNLESKEVLRHLNDMGEFVRSASSTVEPPVLRRLIERLSAAARSADRPAADDAAASSAADTAASTQRADARPTAGNGAFASSRIDGPLPNRATRRPGTDNIEFGGPPIPSIDNPDMDDLAIANFLGVTDQDRRRRQGTNRVRGPHLKRDDSWAKHWITDDERAEWIHAGVLVADDAARYSEAGLNPDDSMRFITLQHMTIVGAVYAKAHGLSDEELNRTVGESTVKEFLSNGATMEEIRQTERDLARSERYRYRGQRSGA